jgi:diguanylate cyclase (GGDEF)-like protein
MGETMMTQDNNQTQGGSFTPPDVSGDGQDAVLPQTLAALAERIAQALDCHECCVYEWTPESAELRPQALWSRRLTQRDRDWVGTVHTLADIPDFQRVIDAGEILFAYADDDEERAKAAGVETMAQWGETAAIWAPILDGDDVLGILELTETTRPRVFNADDERLVRQMASLAAIALRNARVTRAVEERNRQLQALIDASRAMTSTLDLDEVLDAVCRQAALALNAGSSYIYQYDPDDEAMVWLAEYQSDPRHTFEEPIGSVYPIENLPQDLALVRTQRPVELRLDDPALDPVARQQLLGWEEQSTLMVPLLVGENVVGALEVSETTYPRHFTEQEVILCVALGEQAAIAISNAQLYARLEEQKLINEQQAITDGLSGLYNHRHLWDRLRDEVARARRYGQPLSVLMLDLDDFKRVNDRFGHPAGDRVLRAVGDVLREQVRKGVDIPARYGGEEFAVILPCTESTMDDGAALDGAVTSAERLRRAIAELRSPIGEAGSAGISVSIGVATLPAHAVDAEGLVSKADQALYEAKRLGKDQVVVYGPHVAA